MTRVIYFAGALSPAEHELNLTSGCHGKAPVNQGAKRLRVHQKSVESFLEKGLAMHGMPTIAWFGAFGKNATHPYTQTVTRPKGCTVDFC